MEGNQDQEGSKAPEPAAEAQQAAAAPPAQPAPTPESTLPKEAPEHKVAEAQPAKELPLAGNVLLFGKFDVSGVTLRDQGMARYVDISPVAVPHTGGKHTNKPFARAKMSVVERLINGMMRTEDFTGKKLKSYKAVELSFGIIAQKTKANPLQVFVDALQNVAPREEVTRLQYGGISVPKAVDVAPARRVDLALRYICNGALETSHKSKKPIEECLADEIIGAAKNDMNSFSVAKKEEIERVAASAR
ncbi:MAG: 30S ribosomal protein S7 [Candidatus Thermoplasmatota archaeon]|nr:30S ribosomal protein S7 [Candidatus Thermoplasmatota archaeon]